jgi:hypothetical protein
VNLAALAVDKGQARGRAPLHHDERRWHFRRIETAARGERSAALRVRAAFRGD